MASSREFLDFVLEQLKDVENVSFRPMMGEFLLYSCGILFGGVYDDRLLIKKTKSNARFTLEEQLPYDGAKPMLLVENMDDAEYLKELVEKTLKDLRGRK
ncbi:MAG: TfoX/Sxy family protein [Clostridia bacterium]|nr:TfoX/Sxy family protein [Clostridia bacterium]